jgi:hypothetical protein
MFNAVKHPGPAARGEISVLRGLSGSCRRIIDQVNARTAIKSAAVSLAS